MYLYLKRIQGNVKQLWLNSLAEVVTVLSAITISVNPLTPGVHEKVIHT